MGVYSRFAELPASFCFSPLLSLFLFFLGGSDGVFVDTSTFLYEVKRHITLQLQEIKHDEQNMHLIYIPYAKWLILHLAINYF